jgi:predicted nucleic acid-binding protein
MENPIGLLDTNVIIRFVLQDHPEHAAAADDLFEAINRGDLSVRLVDTIVFESVFTLEGFYKLPRVAVAKALLSILSSGGVILPGKEMYASVFALWVDTKRLSFADAFHLISTRELGLERIISFDRGLRGVEGVTRVEPPLG